MIFAVSELKSVKVFSLKWKKNQKCAPIFKRLSDKQDKIGACYHDVDVKPVGEMDEIPAVFAQSHGAIGFTTGEGMERSVWLFYGSLSTQRWTNEKIKFNGPLWRQSDIVLCTNTFPVPRSSLKAPIFCLVRRVYAVHSLVDLRLFVESICENVPLKGKHNIIMQATLNSTYDYLAGHHYL
jgi:hypothetical protein